jgi:hypothetical protein
MHHGGESLDGQMGRRAGKRQLMPDSCGQHALCGRVNRVAGVAKTPGTLPGLGDFENFGDRFWFGFPNFSY